LLVLLGAGVRIW